MSVAPTYHCEDCREIQRLSDIISASEAKIRFNERYGLETVPLETYVSPFEKEKEELERKHNAKYSEMNEKALAS